MPVEKICGHCATPFLVPSRRSETVKFCSVECKSNAKRVTLSCAGCGGSFERPKHLATAKYCSGDCFHSAAKGVAQRPRSERYYRTCEACAVSFRVTLTRKDTARFCSRTCQYQSPAYREEMSDVQRGEKHWRWTGGLYKGGRGYVRIKGHKLAAQRFQLAHRLVVETAMLEMEPNHPFLIEVEGKKRLNPKIDVHHIDQNRSNNAFANLLAVTKRAHARIHSKNVIMPEPWECWPYSHISSNPSQNIKDSAMKDNP